MSDSRQVYTVPGFPLDLEMCTLEVDGQEYSGWQEIRVTRALDKASASFELQVSERWPIQDKSPEPWKITPGKPCSIRFGDTVVLTGFVDSYVPSFASDNHEVRVTGRSKTLDFVDASVMEDGGQFKNMTLEAIVRRLVEPFQLEVVVDESFKGGAKIPEVQVQQGETCFELAEKLCRLQECLITDDPDGRIVLARAGAGKCSSTLKQGGNILLASSTNDHSQRFSEYVVKAQRPGGRTLDGTAEEGSDGPDKEDGDYGEGGDGEDGETPEERLRPVGYESPALVRWRLRMRELADRPRAVLRDFVEARAGSKKKGKNVLTQVGGAVKDPDITRYRPKVIVAESQADAADAAKRADWECRRRIGKALKAQISVVGWRQQDGRLWLTNEMCKCEAPWLSLDRELVISQVEYTFGADGQVCNLELTLPDAFLPEKVREPKKPGGAGKGKGDPWPDLVPLHSKGEPPGHSAAAPPATHPDSGHH